MANTAVNGTTWLRKISGRIADDHILPVSQSRASTLEVEHWLQSFGVSYAPAVMLPMELINEKTSRANQARADAIIPESVERFTNSLKQGAEFPPIVVYQIGGKLSIIDGNNRHESHKKYRAAEIFGIIISAETPSETIQRLTVAANVRHGVTPDLQWRILQAFGLVGLGFTDQEAADDCGINLTQIRTARALREANARAKSMKLSNFTQLPAGARQILGVLKDDAVFYQASHVAAATAMRIDEVRVMVSSLKKLRSEAERIQLIAEISDKRSIEAATKKALGKTPNRVSSAKHSLVTGIGKVLAVDVANLQRQVLTQHDKTILMTRCNEMIVKAAEIDAALQQLHFDED